MPVAGGGFEQCYNAQAAVAADSLLVVAASVVQAPNDKQQLEPMLGKIAELPAELGKVGELACRQRLFQRGQRERLRRRRDRAGDRDGTGEAEAAEAVRILGLQAERLIFLREPDSRAPHAGSAFDAIVRRLVVCLRTFGCSAIAAP